MHDADLQKNPTDEILWATRKISASELLVGQPSFAELWWGALFLFLVPAQLLALGANKLSFQQTNH